MEEKGLTYQQAPVTEKLSRQMEF